MLGFVYSKRASSIKKLSGVIGETHDCKARANRGPGISRRLFRKPDAKTPTINKVIKGKEVVKPVLVARRYKRLNGYIASETEAIDDG